MKFGLRGVRALLKAVDNPHQSFPTVHIAGTNGKGSTAAMLAAMLTAAGYKTGLYTSPHLVDFTERIRINGKPIVKNDVARLTRKLRPFVKRYNPTFFETVTAMAFLYFAETKVDIAVIETGLGGRLDATNVIKPLVSAITTIGLEHTDILGTTIEKIAFEKAGIIKRKVPCVTTVRSAPALKELRHIARLRGSPLTLARTVGTRIVHTDLSETTVHLATNERVYRNLRIGLPGIHQIDNARLALNVVEELRRKSRFVLSESSIRNGLARIKELSGLHARFSVISRKPLMVADVAHNPDAIKMLVASLKSLQVDRCILVFGVSKDKDYVQMIQHLQPIVDRAVVVAAKTERARTTRDLQREFVNLGIPCEAATSVRDGIQRARDLVRSRQHLLLTGSHFVVGEALAFLHGKKYLTINQ